VKKRRDRGKRTASESGRPIPTRRPGPSRRRHGGFVGATLVIIKGRANVNSGGCPEFPLESVSRAFRNARFRSPNAVGPVGEGPQLGNGNEKTSPESGGAWGRGEGGGKKRGPGDERPEGKGKKQKKDPSIDALQIVRRKLKKQSGGDMSGSRCDAVWGINQDVRKRGEERIKGGKGG